HFFSPPSLPPPSPTLFPYTTLFRSHARIVRLEFRAEVYDPDTEEFRPLTAVELGAMAFRGSSIRLRNEDEEDGTTTEGHGTEFQDRKSTRLNSSHVAISYAVFCLKK